MLKKRTIAFHQLAAQAPVATLYVLILYLYAIYMTTYLGKLLSNSYPYDSRRIPSHEGTQAVFLTITTINHHANHFVSFLQTEEVGLSFQEQKGAIYFVILHVLLILLFISIIRTMLTPPGYVAQDWSLKAEVELRRAIIVEKELLKAQWAKRKYHAKAKQEKMQTIILNKEGKIIVEEHPKPEPQEGAKKIVESPPAEAIRGPRSELEIKNEDLLRDIEEELKSDPQLVEQLNQVAFHNAMKKEKKRFCPHCQSFKPPRAHHCRQCNTCILKMDHHCPWVGTCIGFNNYKYFFNMLFYAVLMLWLYVCTYSEPVSDVIYDIGVNPGLVFIVCMTYLLACVLALAVTGFFGFHLWLVTSGRTTLELVEKKEREYDKGFFNNLKAVLGHNILYWCFPCAPNLEGGGVEFEPTDIGNL